MKPVYIAEMTYWNILKQASENDGQVVLDSKGCAPFEIKLDGEWAKKEWEQIITRVYEHVGLGHSDVVSVIDSYLRTDR